MEDKTNAPEPLKEAADLSSICQDLVATEPLKEGAYRGELFLPTTSRLRGDCRNADLRSIHDVATAIEEKYKDCCAAIEEKLSVEVFGKRRLSFLMNTRLEDAKIAFDLAQEIGGYWLDLNRAPVVRLGKVAEKETLRKFCYAASTVSIPPEHVGKYRFLVDTDKK